MAKTLPEALLFPSNAAGLGGVMVWRLHTTLRNPLDEGAAATGARVEAVPSGKGSHPTRHGDGLRML
ncbi:MAG: hypothetical protein ACJAQT_002420 [Akkermansiaceae bacterium]|jgi:hypothetical protein